MTILRHSLVWTATCPVAVSGGADESAFVADWWERGLPFVAARQPSEGHRDLVLGCSPPRAVDSAKPARIACAVRKAALIRVSPPPKLAEVLPTSAAQFRADAETVLAAARELGTAPRVYGSFMWQFLGGEGYVGESSDLDLLWEADGQVSADAITRQLREIEPKLRLRLDGELRFGDQGDVAWREWSQVSADGTAAGTESAATRVLVKRADGIALVAREQLCA